MLTCQCGIQAVSRCSECNQPVCRSHSSRDQPGVPCTWCVDKDSLAYQEVVALYERTVSMLLNDPQLVDRAAENAEAVEVRLQVRDREQDSYHPGYFGRQWVWQFVGRGRLLGEFSSNHGPSAGYALLDDGVIVAGELSSGEVVVPETYHESNTHKSDFRYEYQRASTPRWLGVSSTLTVTKTGRFSKREELQIDIAPTGRRTVAEIAPALAHRFAIEALKGAGNRKHISLLDVQRPNYL